MRITRPDGTMIEFDDTAPSKDGEADVSKAPETPKASKPETTKSETITKLDTAPDTPTPGPVSTPSAPVSFTEPPAPSELSTGTLYGGAPNVSDPDKGKRGFQWMPPREE
jgi:hypothetical protein